MVPPPPDMWGYKGPRTQSAERFQLLNYTPPVSWLPCAELPQNLPGTSPKPPQTPSEGLVVPDKSSGTLITDPLAGPGRAGPGRPGPGRAWKGMEGHGRAWKGMEAHTCSYLLIPAHTCSYLLAAFLCIRGTFEPMGMNAARPVRYNARSEAM